jgi:prevent-host-death family protein
MHDWSVQDAKVRFVEMLEACMAEGPQLVTLRGAEVAVLVPAHEWRRLKAEARASLKSLLLEESSRVDTATPERARPQHRRADSLD